MKEAPTLESLTLSRIAHRSGEELYVGYINYLRDTITIRKGKRVIYQCAISEYTNFEGDFKAFMIDRTNV